MTLLVAPLTSPITLGNDAPLASFSEMPFFSVARSIDETPPGVPHVGGLEFGTAVVLDRLCDMLEERRARVSVMV